MYRFITKFAVSFMVLATLAGTAYAMDCCCCKDGQKAGCCDEKKAEHSH